jgi:hypothetical protein
MQSMYYVGLDVHKKTISYCVTGVSGSVHAEGSVHATRSDLDRWMKILPQPWKPRFSPAGSTIILSHTLPLADGRRWSES